MEATTVRPTRTWQLRNRRNDPGQALTPSERRIHPDADLVGLVAAVVQTALGDLDAGYDDYSDSNCRYWRAQAYLFFFHGQPTGFERFAARLGVTTHGRLPPHPLLDDADALAGRRSDLARLGLPLDLFDARIAALNAAQMESGRAVSVQ